MVEEHIKYDEGHDALLIKCPFFKKGEIIMEYSREENRRLCDTYPFLIPYNRFSGKLINCGEKGFWPDNPDAMPEWDYEFTELDNMPDGWRQAFGERMCAEIKQALLEEGGEELLHQYRIVQIKEKYGSLRWYDNFTFDELDAITSKYINLSARTCIQCGAPATKLSRGWIAPYCDDCSKDDDPEDYASLDETLI